MSKGKLMSAWRPGNRVRHAFGYLRTLALVMGMLMVLSYVIWMLGRGLDMILFDLLPDITWPE